MPACKRPPLDACVYSFFFPLSFAFAARRSQIPIYKWGISCTLQAFAAAYEFYGLADAVFFYYIAYSCLTHGSVVNLHYSTKSLATLLD